MAYPPIPYRASEPSQMETQLAVLATDPARAGAAMQLLPGAAAIRQDIGARANLEADRDAALAAITQNETARHQRSGDATNVLALSQPGAARIGMALPINQALFGDAPPGVNAIADANMSGQFRQQDANIQDKNADAYLKGVQSGYTTPLDVASRQQGYNINLQEPEQIRLQRIRDAAAAARQASAQTAEQFKPAVYSYTTDPATGKGHYGVQSIPPGMDPRVVEQNVQLLNAGQGHIETGDDGSQRYVPGEFTPPTQGVMTNRKTHMPGATVTVGAGAPTAQAGRSLPFAKTEGGGPTPATTQAPPSGVVYTRDAPLPANADEVLRKFIASQPANKQQAYATAAHDGTLKFGQDAQGQLYITLNGRAITKPLTPRAQQ